MIYDLSEYRRRGFGVRIFGVAKSVSLVCSLLSQVEQDIAQIRADRFRLRFAVVQG